MSNNHGRGTMLGRVMRGVTWDTSNDMAPLIAASRRWRAETGVEIEWESRSLNASRSSPLEELAHDYDLIVLDHPQIGQASEAECLAPLETMFDFATLDEIAGGSVGRSFQSYNWDARQWAFPIGAAAQVQAWVPGRIAAPISAMADLAPLLRTGAASIPLCAPHALMTLFTLCGLGGITLEVEADILFPDDACIAFERLAEMAALADPAAWSMDPIALLEAMAEPRSRIASAPFIFGCVNYSQEGFRQASVHFADLPTIDGTPRGSALTGSGIAVSRFGMNPRLAARFAAWIASGPIQRDLFGHAGGQPAHASAWDDANVNRSAGDFYRSTRQTLDLAWLPPRHVGYIAFQRAASERLEEAVRKREPADRALAALNALYRELR